MSESPLKTLPALGQSPWLDFIERTLLTNGELDRMIGEWGLKGVTSNPAIFEKGIAHSDAYASEIEKLSDGGRSAPEIYEQLAFADVRTACDRFAGVFADTGGTDGFVSLEVSPHLARDAGRTIDEARRIWQALERPNAMIKVPGTREGLIAIRSLLAEGINVNVTLLFSVERYREVLEAYLDGLDAAFAAGRDLSRIASVASFFLSRIDTLVDGRLDALAAAGDARGRQAASLRGEVAIASARAAYGVLVESLGSDRFVALKARGARPQRLLWASTSTKDPAYSDVKYVEPLIGPWTVNTMPLATLEAYDDHGRPAGRLDADWPRGAAVLEAVENLGIDLAEATAALLDEGIDKFVAPYDSLLAALSPRSR